MKYMVTYDLMETARNTNEWLGATARAAASYPVFGLATNPAIQLMAAWGEVTERSFSRMTVKPDWGIDTVAGDDGRDHVVSVRTVVERPFGDLIHFDVSGRGPMPRRVLLVAPMSGHYATLLRSTVRSLLPDCDVYVTDWRNARDIPVSAGKFDVEDYTLYLADFVRHLGPDIHVVAVCQPVPLALAATAWLAQEEPGAQPATLTLIGGPVDPDAAATDVTDFGRRVTMGQLERSIVQRVGFKFAGAGRMVYPGLLQLASFMSMNAERHSRAFTDQILAVAKGEASDHDRHNRFYDEYLAVMDMTAEFYLSTVERIFKQREIARNAFTIGGRPVDLGRIEDVAVHVVEGEDDDISAPGQCLAALDLLTGVPAERKAAHLEPGAGHYGIFAGGSWRRNIRPLVLSFIDANARPAAKGGVPVPERPASPAPATLGEAERIAAGQTEAGSMPTAPVAERSEPKAPRAAATRAERKAPVAIAAESEARAPRAAGTRAERMASGAVAAVSEARVPHSAASEPKAPTPAADDLGQKALHAVAASFEQKAPPAVAAESGPKAPHADAGPSEATPPGKKAAGKAGRKASRQPAPPVAPPKAGPKGGPTPV